MDASVTVSIISGVGVILSAWFAMAGNKKGTLAEAEQNFRSTILADNEKLRQRVDELEKKLINVVAENGQLKAKVTQLETNQAHVNDHADDVPLDGGMPHE